MFLIPCDRYKIKTSKNSSEVYSLMDIIVEASKINFFRVALGAESTFIGNVTDKGFKIAHTTMFHNCFYPIIDGKYEEVENGTEISMISHPPYLAILLAVVVYVAIIFAFNFKAVYLIATLPVLYLSILLPYKYFAKRSKKEILTLLGDDF